jgi:hypothetical protein
MKTLLSKALCALTVSFLTLTFTISTQAAPKKILLYGPTLKANGEIDFINSHPTEFQHIEQAPTPGSRVFNDQNWVNATVADFQQFDAIIISDLGTYDPAVPQAVAIASRAIWGSAVNGNILVVAGDPRQDLVPRGDDIPAITAQGIRFAADQPGEAHTQTGLYVAIDHLKVGDDMGVPGGLIVQNPTEIPILKWLGSFRAIEIRGNGPQVRMIMEHPILDVVGRNVGGYTLEGGSDKTQGFYSWPAGFYPMAYRLYDPAPTPASNVTPLVESDTGYEVHTDTGAQCSSGQAPMVYILAKTAVTEALHRLEPSVPNIALQAGQTVNLAAYSTFAGSPDPNSPGPSDQVLWSVLTGPNAGQNGVMLHSPTTSIWTTSYNGTTAVTPQFFQDVVQFSYASGYAVTMTVNWHPLNVPELTVAGTVPAAVEGGPSAKFEISRPHNLNGTALTVQFCIGGTATAGTSGAFNPDYSLTAQPSGASVDINNGIAVIPAGSDFIDISVNPVDDTLVEPTETVYLALQDVFDGSYVVAGNGYTTVTIQDNDYVSGASAGGNANATEGSIPGSWIINTPAHPTSPFNVYFTLSGTASNAVDYIPDLFQAVNDSDSHDNIILPSGLCRATLRPWAGPGGAGTFINCTALQDSRTEGTETATINILPHPNYTIYAGGNSGTINILDDDSTKIPAGGYTIVDIGDASHMSTAAWALNNQAGPTVVGDFLNPQGLLRGYSWVAGTFTDLPVIQQLGSGNSEFLSARAVNDILWVAGPGRSEQASPLVDADYYYVRINGNSTQLSASSSGSANFALGPLGMNKDGHIVGGTVNGAASSRASLWDGNHNFNLSDVGALSALAESPSGASAINTLANGALVTGWSQFDVPIDPNTGSSVTPGASLHAFRTQPASLFINPSTDDLGNALSSDTSQSAGYAINSLGEIAGVSDYAPPSANGNPTFSGEVRAAYKDGHSGKHMGWKTLNILSGGAASGLTSQALGINDLGVIVGWSRTITSGNGQPKAVVWENTADPAAVDLNTKIPTAAQTLWVLTNATAINNNGAIAGIGTKVINGNGPPQQRAFLLMPVSASGTDLIADTIFVDAADNITGVSYTGSGSFALNTWITKNKQSYLGGLFTRFVVNNVDTSGSPAVFRQVNSGPRTLVQVHGFSSGNSMVVNNVVGLLWNSVGGFYTAQQLNQGPLGGTGVAGGAVTALAIPTYINDLYLAGSFNSAGGFNYSAGIGVYRASGGWQNMYIFSASGATSLSWVNSVKLRVSGVNLHQVNGPTYSYDHNSDYLNVSGVAYWNLNPGNSGFDGGYWSAN